MEFYTISDKKNVIYEGIVNDAKTSIKCYHRLEDGKWVKYDNNDSHIDFAITKAFKLGKVSRFYSLDEAAAAL